MPWRPRKERRRDFTCKPGLPCVCRRSEPQKSDGGGRSRHADATLRQKQRRHIDGSADRRVGRWHDQKLEPSRYPCRTDSARLCKRLGERRNAGTEGVRHLLRSLPWSGWSGGKSSPGGKGVNTGSLVDPSYLALISDQSLRSTTIAGDPEQGMPDWRHDLSEAGARALTDQEITDIVAWLASHRTSAPGQPYASGEQR